MYTPGAEDMLEKSEGSSGETCRGMLKMLQDAQPTIHIWENVPNLLQPRNARNLRFLTMALMSCGFEHAHAILNSSDYCHPTRRERAFGVCVNFRRLHLDPGHAQALARRILMFTTDELQVDAVPLQAFLLSEGSHHVRRDIAHLQCVKEPTQAREHTLAHVGTLAIKAVLMMR